MYNKQPTFIIQSEISFCDYNNTECIRQFFIVLLILLIFRLGNKYMSQIVTALQFKQCLKIMCLVSLDAKPVH